MVDERSPREASADHGDVTKIAVIQRLPPALRILRPWQWSKNALVLGPLLFSHRLLKPQSLLDALIAFALFCLLSGAVYILNDIRDREMDRKHPLKSQRPLAAGTLSLGVAWAMFVVTIGVALGGAYAVDFWFGVLSTAYAVLMILYTLRLKSVVVVDVLVVAIGFLLRVVCGAVAIGEQFSAWLLLCTFFLALFLVLNKRRHEIRLLKGDARHHRKVLGEYSAYLLDQMIGVSTAGAVITYALYTRAEETVAHVGSSNLVYTIPFVVYGVFRYLYLVHEKNTGGSPELTLVTDVPMVMNVILWAAVSVLIVYAR